MLELTQQMQFIPGSNLKGQVAGANWAFLLPDLALERVVCFGAPSARTLAALARLSGEVIIVSREPASTGGPNITTLAWDASTGLPPALAERQSAVDVLLVRGGGMVRALSASPALQRDLRGLLKPGGTLYLELDTPWERLTAGQSVLRLAQALGAPQVYWSTPLNGELHAAVPAEDPATIDYFVRHGLYRPEIKKRWLKPAARMVSQRLAGHPLTRRYSILARKTGGEEPSAPPISPAPPAYLREIASRSGIDLHAHRWGLAAHGEYSTRKVLFYLFRPGDSAPEYIVKMVRDPAFNLRLENEHRALSALREIGGGAHSGGAALSGGATKCGDWFPKPAFFGYAGRLALLAEEAVDGEDFRKRTTFRPDCGYAQQAIQVLTRLGADTLDPQGASPYAANSAAAEILRKLFDRFVEIYQPEPPIRAFLEAQIRTIAAQPRNIPLVFQHGDPGAWNMLVTRDNRVVLLDWESAEADGLPLWDLFYFLRSYAVGAGRKAGIRSPIQAFQRFFFEDVAFSGWVLDAVEQYRQALGLPESLVEPLFYTCWMHRSLKEANRLSPRKMQTGHYYNLLCDAIQQRDAPALSHLFQNDPSIEAVM